MSRTKQEKNKTFILAAFDTLFNKRDYVASKDAIGLLITFNIALLSHLVARGC